MMNFVFYGTEEFKLEIFKQFRYEYVMSIKIVKINKEMGNRTTAFVHFLVHSPNNWWDIAKSLISYLFYLVLFQGKFQDYQTQHFCLHKCYPAIYEVLIISFIRTSNFSYLVILAIHFQINYQTQTICLNKCCPAIYVVLIISFTSHIYKSQDGQTMNQRYKSKCSEDRRLIRRLHKRLCHPPIPSAQASHTPSALSFTLPIQPNQNQIKATSLSSYFFRLHHDYKYIKSSLYFSHSYSRHRSVSFTFTQEIHRHDGEDKKQWCRQSWIHDNVNGGDGGFSLGA